MYIFFISILILLLTNITITDLLIYIASFIIFYNLLKSYKIDEWNRYHDIGRLRYNNIMNNVRNNVNIDNYLNEYYDREFENQMNNIIPIRFNIVINNTEINFGGDENDTDFEDNELQSPIFDNQDRIFVDDDKENVHDTSVNKSIKLCIDSLIKNIDLDNIEEKFLDSIIDKVYNKITLDNKYLGIFPLLEQIYRNQHIKIISCGYDLSLYEVLYLVWKRIETYSSSIKKKNAINSLILQLYDSIGICNTGILNRIVDSLNLIDNDIKILPKWAIQREMMDKAGVIREILIKKLNIKLDKIDEDSIVFIEFKDAFKNELLNEFEIYSKYFNEGELKKEIDIWMECL